MNDTFQEPGDFFFLQYFPISVAKEWFDLILFVVSCCVLLKDTTQWPRWGWNPQPLCQALSTTGPLCPPPPPPKKMNSLRTTSISPSTVPSSSLPKAELTANILSIAFSVGQRLVKLDEFLHPVHDVFLLGGSILNLWQTGSQTQKFLTP